MNKLDKFNKNNNNFDFVRLMAAIGVLFTHCFDLSDRASLEPLRLLDANSFSFYAVRIFFIISGYLITQSALNSSSALSYFSKRVLRIFPALVVTVVISAFILGPVVTDLGITAYFTSGETYSYLSNICLYCNQQELPGVFKTINHTPLVNGSLWTLVYEFTFYVGIYCLHRLGLLTKRLFLFVLFLAVICCEYYLQNNPVLMAYYPSVNMSVGPLIEFSVFFAGGVLHYLYRKEIVFNNLYGLAMTALLFISVIMFPSALNRIIVYILLPYIVFCFSFTKSVVNNFGKNGDFSYGIYLYSFPVQQVILHYFPSINIVLFFILALTVTAVFAYFSWHYIESPMLRFKFRTNTKMTDLVNRTQPSV